MCKTGEKKKRERDKTQSTKNSNSIYSTVQ